MNREQTRSEQESGWRAVWVSRPGALLLGDSPDTGPAPHFRKVFAMDQEWQSASVRICGVGFYELYLNGRKVGDHVLDPAFTDYAKRLRYVTHDVSPFLRQGDNVIGVVLGNGWYNSPWNLWRSYPRMALQLELDGVRVVSSDTTWKTATGPITYNGIRNGESYDARQELTGWLDVPYADAGWQNAERVLPPGGILEEQVMPPCKVTETLPVHAQHSLESGGHVYDFGENIAGWCRMRVRGVPGAVVTLQYAERLTPEGDIDQEHIGIFVPSGENQTDRYTLRGGGEETWEPRFTYHGFQYCKVSVEGEADILGIEARVVHTAFESTGSFASSDHTLNNLQACFRRSYVGNFVGIPTDCPHREKCGWTGDALLAAESGLLNYGSGPSYAQWLANFPDLQRPNGQMHGVIPYCEGVLAWESGTPFDAALILLPWYLYLYTADLTPALRLYDAMKRYLGFCASMAEGHIVEFGLDDWCHPASPNEHPWKERNGHSKAPLAMLCTAYYYTACKTFAAIAGLAERRDEQHEYNDLADSIRAAFNQRFYRGDGVYANGCQTALGCALYHELAEADAVPLVARQLADTVHAANYKVDFGIVGSKYVLRALAEHGYVDAAYRVLTQPEYPGYAHWLSLGATTLFEQWDGSKSRNHVCFGDFSAWMYRYLAGLAPTPDRPGFKHMVIQPRRVAGLQWVEAEHRCSYGPIRIRWETDSQGFALDVEIPDRTTATVVLPGRTTQNVASGRHRFDSQVPTAHDNKVHI